MAILSNSLSDTGNPIDDSNLALNNFAQANPILLNEELDTNATTGFYKKLIDTNLSVATKMDMIQEKALQKNLNVQDYRVGTLKGLLGHHSKAELYAEDDPFFNNKEEGNPVLLDSFYNTRKRISNSIAAWDEYIDNKYKNPDLLSQLLQKPKELLTPEDTNSPLVQEAVNVDKRNYRNYWDNIVYDSLSKDDFKFKSFDPKKVYAPVDSSKDIPIGYRVLGENDNLYELHGEKRTVHNIEAINLKTGNDLYFDLAKIPLYGQNVSLYNTLDTSANRSKQQKYEQGVTDLNTLAYDPTISLRNNAQYLSDMDTDSYAGELVDQFKSQGLQSFARFMKNNLPKEYEKFWDKYANSKDGQLWSDLVAGVSQKTRDDFSEVGRDIADYVAKGDLVSASELAIKNLGGFLAESAPQMGMMIASALALRKMPVNDVTQKLAKASAIALPVALDKVYADLEDFKVKNKREMTPYERTRTFIGALATSIPEVLLLSMFEKTSRPFRSIVKKALGMSSGEVAVKTGGELLKNIGKTTLKASVGEGGQEYAETAWDTASSADQSTGSFGEQLKKAATDKETLAASLIGFYMGGATAGAVEGLNTATNFSNIRARNKFINEKVDYASTHTVSGESANVEKTKDAQKIANDILSSITDKSSADDKLQASAQLQHLVSKGKNDLDIRTRNNLLVQKAAWDKEAITSYLQEGLSKEEIEKRIGTNIERAMASQLWFSHVNPMTDLLNKRKPNEETIEATKEEVRTLGKKLGMDEDYVEYLIEETATGLRTSENTHLDTIADLNHTVDILKGKKLTPDEKKGLENKLKEDFTDLTNQFLAKAEIVQAISDAIPDLLRSGNVTSTSASIRGGKQYQILADDIASNTLEKGKGTYRIVRNLLNDMRDIAETLNEYKSQKNLTGLISNIVDSNGNVNLDAIEGLESQFKNLTNNVRIKVMNEQTKFNESISKDRPKFVNTLTGQLQWLASNPTRTDDPHYGMFTHNINAAINSDPTIIDDLKASIDSRTKFSQQGRENMHKALENVIDFNKTIKAGQEASLKERERGITNLDKLLNDNTLEEIEKNAIDEKADSTEDKQHKLGTLNSLLNAFTHVQRHFNTISDNSKEDLKRREELAKRRNKIITLLGQARNSVIFAGEERLLNTKRNVKPEDITQDTNDYIEKLEKIKSESELKKRLDKVHAEFSKARAANDAKVADNASLKWRAIVDRMEALGLKLPRVVTEMREALAKQEAQSKAFNSAQTANKGSESPSNASEASGQEITQGKPADASEGPSRAEKGHVEGKGQEAQAHISDMARAKVTVHILSAGGTRARVIANAKTKGVSVSDKTAVRNADCVFVITETNPEDNTFDFSAREQIIARDTTRGGIPTYMYDVTDKTWYSVKLKDGNITTEKLNNKIIPSLTKNSAIVSFNNTNEEADRVIDSLFDETISKLKNDTTKIAPEDNYKSSTQTTQVTPTIPNVTLTTETNLSSTASLSKEEINRTKKYTLERLKALREKYLAKIDDYAKRQQSLTPEERTDLEHSQRYYDLIEEQLARKSGELSDERLTENKEKIKSPKTVTEAIDAVSANAKNSFQNKQAERLGLAEQQQPKPAKDGETQEQPQDGMENTSDQKRDEAPAKSQTKLLLNSERAILQIRERYKDHRDTDSLDPSDQVKAGRPDCLLALDPELYFNTHLLGATQRNKDFLNMLKTMRFSPHFLHETTEGGPITDPLAYITTRQNEEGLSQSSFLGNAPHFLFLYDVDPDHKDQPKDSNGKTVVTPKFWKPNRYTFMIVDYSLREFFGTTGLEQYFAYGKIPSKDEIANMFGLSPDSLSFEQIEQLQGLIKEYGIPRSMLAETIGRIIVENLGLREKFETSNLDYYEKLVAGFGAFAVDWGAKFLFNEGKNQGLYELTNFDVDAWYLDNISSLASSESLVVTKPAPSDINLNDLTTQLNKLKNLNNEDLNKEQQERKKQILKVLDDSLATVPKGNTTVDNRNIRVFNEAFVKSITKYVLKGDTGHILNNNVNCVKVKADAIETIQRIKTEFRGSLDEKSGKLNDDGLSQLKVPKSRSSAKPHWDKPTVYDLYNTAVRNTGGKVLASPFRVLAMQELSNCAYQVDNDAISFLNEEVDDPDNKGQKIRLWDTVGAIHGWQTQDEIDRLSYSGQLSAEGVNTSIQNDIAYIRDALATQNDMIKEGTFKGMFFDFFLARNGRINNASTTINQQSSKLARFMVLPQKVWRMFNPDDEEQIEFENYAITQAFDTQGKNKQELTESADFLKSLSKNELIELRKRLCIYTQPKFTQWVEETYKDNPKYKHELGVENFAQCLNALAHLIKRADSNGKAFTTSLAVENDSTTSGYANKVVNFADQKTITATDKGKQSTIASKVGIHIIPAEKAYNLTEATTTAHESKKFLPSVLLANAEESVQNLDMYKTVSLNVTDIISSFVTPEGEVKNAEALRKVFLESLGPSFKNQSNAIEKAVDELVDIFKVMSPALPKAVAGEVSSELRTMMKNPTMVFIYSAGVNTMAKNVAVKIMEDFLNLYVAAKDQLKVDDPSNITNTELLKRYKEQVRLDPRVADLADKDDASREAIMRTIDKIAEKFVPDPNNPEETFLEALKTRPYSSIRIKQAGRHITLDTLFNRLIGSTYGQPAADTLGNIFEKFVHANDDFIQMTSMMFELYNEVYTEELDSLRTTKGKVIKNEIKSAAVREMEKRISNMLPYITLPDNIHRANTDSSKLLMIKSTKSMNKTNRAQNYMLDETGRLIQGTSAYGASRVPERPGRSGAVLGIHGMDGHIISMIAAKYAKEGIAVIHDAYVSSAFVHEEISHDYNEFLVTANLNYNLYGNVLENFKRVYDNYIEYRVNKAFETEFDPDAYVSEQDMRNARRKLKAELREEITVALRNRTVKGGNGESIYINSKDKLTLGKLLDDCTNTNQDVIASRNWLMQQYIMATNMDSARPQGAALITPNSVFGYEQAFHEIVNNAHNWTTADMHGSHPHGFITSGMLHTIYEQALNSTEARVESLSYLREVSRAKGEKDVSDEHFKYLQDIIRSIPYEKNTETILNLVDNGLYTAGQVEIKGNKNTISIALGDKSNGIVLDSVTGLSACSYMSPVEIIAHEMMHIANDYAFKHRNEFRINKLINKLLRNRDEAAKIITEEDFMPPKGSYDESLEDTYRELAKKRWHYYFDNDNSNNLESLNEYCAFVATNEEVRKRLRDRYPEGSNRYKDLKFLDKLIQIAKDIYDVVFGPKTFKEAYNNIYEVIKGNASIRQKSLLEDFDTLTTQMRTVQNKVKNRLLEHPMRWLECLFSIAGQSINWADKHLHDLLYKAFNYSDLHGGPKYGTYVQNIPLYATTGQKLKESFNIAKYFFTSGEQRRYAKAIFADTIKIHQQGIFMSTLRDFLGPDKDTSMLEALGLRLRSVDRASKGLESATYNELKEAFDKELNDFENVSLTNCFLYTDLQCCADYGLKTIRSWLADDKAIDQEIANLQKNFDGVYNIRQRTWLNNQINNLAAFLVYHVGNPGMNYNAENIAKGLGYQGKINVNDSHIEIIDKLITLTALKHTDQNYRNVVNSLNNKGLSNFLNTHRKFVEESKKGIEIELEDGSIDRYQFMSSHQVIKGYTKQLTDPNLELEVAVVDPTDPNKLYNQGYKLIESLKPNAVTNRSGVGLYTRFGLPLHTDGAIVSLQGVKILGQSLRKLAWNMADEYPAIIPDSNKLFTVYRNEGDKQYIALNKLMGEKELSFEDCAKLHEKYSGYIPQPSSNSSAMPTDYNITISRDIKRNKLGLDERALTVLSKMYGSVTRQINGTVANNVLLQFLRQSENNIIKDHKDKDGNRYIKLEENSPNKYLQKMWKAVPQSFKDDISTNGDLWIREDWLQDLFGVQNYTLNNAKWMQKIPSHWLKRAVALAEMIFKTIAYYRKQTIVIRIPGVLIGNIISNLAYSIVNHKNPIKVFQYTLANAQAIRDYLDTKKEQNRILLKRRLGTATEAEIAKAHRLQDRLNNNRVAPLMKKGMYQAIVEDLNPDDLESIGMINKFVKKNKVLQKLPNAVKWTAKQLYMSEGTPIYDFMFTATQYSDFIARATEYQLCMEKVPAEYNEAVKEGNLQINKKTKKLETKEDFMKRREQEISTAITNAFINYDKPQSQAEQYLNDLGFLMFTKFAKRIQHVIGRQLYHKPISAILFLLSQHFLVDTEDILEQNVFNKHWSALVHNPIENFLDAVVPMPIQFIFGDQKVI